MQSLVKHWWPEILISLVALYFFCRELGTFPAVWSDDGLFMLVAQQIAAGKGIMLPVLEHEWQNPYVLAVGPVLLHPVALVIKLFGFSVEAARLPMVLYLIAMTVSTYVFTKKVINRTAALYACGLLITLSAFVNTGKPVLGEVPAAFCLMLCLILMLKQSRARTIWAGILLGGAITTKMTYGVALPAFGIAAVVAFLYKKKAQWQQLITVSVIGGLIFLAWNIPQILAKEGWMEELGTFAVGNDWELIGATLLIDQLETLLRVPFLAFGTLFVLGTIGWWQLRKKVPYVILIGLPITILLLITYFATGPGWYRHLLLAHMFLLPFVPTGTWQLLGKKLGSVFLILIIAMQGYWQWDHRGSNGSTAAAETAQYLVENYAETDLIIRQVEVFVRLPVNPRWLFITSEGLSSHMPQSLVTMTDAQKCLPLLHVIPGNKREELGERYTHIAGRYGIISPGPEC